MVLEWGAVLKFGAVGLPRPCMAGRGAMLPLLLPLLRWQGVMEDGECGGAEAQV